MRRGQSGHSHGLPLETAHKSCWRIAGNPASDRPGIAVDPIGVRNASLSWRDRRGMIFSIFVQSSLRHGHWRRTLRASQEKATMQCSEGVALSYRVTTHGKKLQHVPQALMRVDEAQWSAHAVLPGRHEMLFFLWQGSWGRMLVDVRIFPGT